MSKRSYAEARTRDETPKRGWAQSTRERLEGQEHDEVAPQGRSTRHRWEEASGSMSSSIPVGASRPTPAMFDDMEKGWNKFLLSTCLRLADYNPVENTTMVCGRPVQVSLFMWCWPSFPVPRRP